MVVNRMVKVVRELGSDRPDLQFHQLSFCSAACYRCVGRFLYQCFCSQAPEIYYYYISGACEFEGMYAQQNA